MNQTFSNWLYSYYKNPKGERIGQAFVNDFIKEPWPELFYCENYEESAEMILEWLSSHCYVFTMPKKNEGR